MNFANLWNNYFFEFIDPHNASDKKLLAVVIIQQLQYKQWQWESYLHEHMFNNTSTDSSITLNFRILDVEVLVC